MKLIQSKEKKKILEKLNEQYGITHLPYIILKFGEEKLRLFSGNLTKEELFFLDKEFRIENAGLYFAKFENTDLRLTFDSLTIFKDQITKNILELNDKEELDWLKGNDLLIKNEKGFKILKTNDEFIGCGRSTGEKITNFMPKERRIR